MKRFLALTAVVVLAAGAALAAPAAKETFEARCSVCHGIDRSLSAAKDRSGWEATVKRMQARAAGMISDDDAKQIIDYLAGLRGAK